MKQKADQVVIKRVGILPSLLVGESSQEPATTACLFCAKLLTASQLQAFQSAIIFSLLHFGATEWVSGLTDTEGIVPNPRHLALPKRQHMPWPSV